MEETPKRPWALSKEANELWFKENTFRSLLKHLKQLADSVHVSYEVDDRKEAAFIRPTHGDFSLFVAQARSVVLTLNEMLQHKEKSFFIEVENYGEAGLQLHIVTKK